MKTFALVRVAAVALLGSAPLFAHAADTTVVQRCMDKFAAESFADRTTSFAKVQNEGPLLPLIANTGTRHVLLTASQPSSGRVLATANCTVRGDATTLSDVIVATEISDR